jgi:imidazolonepropionase-like amidohydrolase
MPKVLELARRMYVAGVPLLIGTDGYGAAPAYWRELALHVEAGIPAWDALGLATSLAADRLGIGSETGRIESGLEADIVFLNENPLENIANVQDVYLVVSDGAAYSQEELAAQSRELAR